MNKPPPVNSPVPDEFVQTLDSALAKLEREIKSEPDKYRRTLLNAQKYRLEARLEALRSANSAPLVRAEASPKDEATRQAVAQEREAPVGDNREPP